MVVSAGARMQALAQPSNAMIAHARRHNDDLASAATGMLTDLVWVTFDFHFALTTWNPISAGHALTPRRRSGHCTLPPLSAPSGPTL